jgi:hypothetical protein
VTIAEPDRPAEESSPEGTPPGAAVRHPEPARRTILRRIFEAGIFALLLALAFLPAVLIVLASWSGGLTEVPVLPELDELWHRLPFLSGLSLPSFFLLILAGYLAILVLFMIRRRDASPWLPVALTRVGRRVRVRPRAATVLLALSAVTLAAILARIVKTRSAPGWEFFAPLALFLTSRLFAEVSPATLGRLWRRRLRVLPLAVLLQLMTLVAAAAMLDGRPLAWLSLALVAVAAAGALRLGRRMPIWAWIVALAIAARMLYLGAWWYALVGDESSFWGTARDILLRAKAAEINERLFTMSGVYNQFPFIASVVQAAGMAIGGLDNFGWKVSSILLSALAIPLYFSFFRTFAGRRVATFASVLLAASHYLMSFSKIGYSNLFAHFTMALVLATAGFAARTRRPFAYTCLGFAAGTCFYVYPAALYCLPLPALLLAVYDPPRTRAAIGRWATAATSAMLLVFPLLLDPEFFLSKLPGLSVGNQDLQVTGVSPWLHLARNVFYASMSHLFKPGESHFVGISYQDPISAGLIALGAAVVLRRLPKDRFAMFLTAGWAVLVVACSTHGTTFPPTTRMFMVLPFFSLCAAVGLSWIVDRCRALGAPARLTGVAAAAVLAAAFGMNLWQAYVLSPHRMVMYQGIEAQFVRVALNVRKLRQEPGRHFIFITREWTVGYGFYDLREMYDLPPLFDMKLEGNQLPAGAVARLRERSAIVVIRPEIEPDVRTELERILAGAGKTPCSFENFAGQVQLVTWQSAELPRLCP